MKVTLVKSHLRCAPLDQTDFDHDRVVNELKKEITALKKQLAQKDEIIQNSIEATVMESEKTCKFYTGRTRAEIKVIWDLLGNEEEKAQMTILGLKTRKGKQRYSGDLNISPFTQFLIAMMKLRRGYYYIEFHIRFKLNQNMVAKVTHTWLQVLYLTFYDMRNEMFVKTSDITKPVPRAFRNSYLRNVRTVIDCTEFFVESSKNQRQQGNIWSDYKHHTTYKALVAVAPSGACQFVSECYEGSITDKAITQDSGFYEHINDGDLVMADRGFTIGFPYRSYHKDWNSFWL